MEFLLQQIGESIVFVIIAACFMLSMVVKSITRITVSLGREHTRREIAAYVAEGTITPEYGERILRAEVRAGRDPSL